MRKDGHYTLKTNEALDFAVLTGCLRVSKESIFTGLNNFKILSITDTRFDEHFGFTDAEVERLLAFYHLENRFAETKEWYDGYHFGNVDVYCPWDVINHVDRIKDDPMAGPEAYWINTSGNELVKRFIDKAGKTTRNEIERLIAGEAIDKQIRLDMTYDEIDNNLILRLLILACFLVIFCVDYICYSIFAMISGSVAFSNICARVISSIFNFSMNKKFVFKNKEGIAKTAAKYFLLAALILSANTIMLELCVKYLIHNKYISKILIEVLLFFISWAAQKSFVFRKRERKIDE